LQIGLGVLKIVNNQKLGPTFSATLYRPTCVTWLRNTYFSCNACSHKTLDAWCDPSSIVKQFTTYY